MERSKKRGRIGDSQETRETQGDREILRGKGSVCEGTEIARRDKSIPHKRKRSQDGTEESKVQPIEVGYDQREAKITGEER